MKHSYLHITILSICILFSTFALSARKVNSYKGKVKDGYNFWLSEPDDNGEAKPLLLFLHGASLCGNNLDRVRRYGPLDAMEKGRKIDAFVLAPQNNGGSWNPQKVKRVVDWVFENYKVDKNRVYVLGMSLGGYGVIDFVSTYPDDIAAAMALCGGGTGSNLASLNNVPLWIIHGLADRAVTVSESDRVVNIMKKADKKTPRLLYDKVPGMNHADPARFLYLNETYQWLMSHNLMDEGRPVSKGFKITPELTKRAYMGLRSGGSNAKAVKKTGTPRKKSAQKRSKRK